MNAVLNEDGQVVLTMTLDEAVLIHERVALAEWAEDLAVVELPEAVGQRLFSDVQQALAPLVPELGTDRYGTAVESAQQRIQAARNHD